MFKSSTWMGEKKIKAVFKMQFHATQVPLLRAKSLMISLVPADVGKPTVRLGKAAILEGTCSWVNPIYETVKLVKQTKTGKLKGKIYYFIVSTGSSKTGFLGEAAVDFADFLGTTKPVMLSLPLEASDSGAILHVTIQKLEGSLDQSYFEEDESASNKSRNESLEMDLEDAAKFQNRNLLFTEEDDIKNTTPHHPEQNGSLRDPQFENRSACEDFTTVMKNMYQKASVISSPPDGQVQQVSKQDWSFRSTPDRTVSETSNNTKENFLREGIHETSNEATERLITQIKMLERQAEVSELELESLRKQILKESRKVQDLLRQIVDLKKERDALKAGSGHGKSLPERLDGEEVSNNPQTETENLRETVEEIRQKLQHEQHLNRKLKFQLHKTEDSNSELILALRDLKELLNKKDKEIPHLPTKIKANQNDPKASVEASNYIKNQNEETREKLAEEHSKEDEVEVLKEEIRNLNSVIQLSRKEEEEIKVCMEQLSVDYEILKKEKTDIDSELQQKQAVMMEMQHEYSLSLTTVKQLKIQKERLEEEIKRKAQLHSESLITINELDTQVKSMKEELEKKAQEYEADMKAVTQAKVEQEQRAIQAEEALRQANWNNTNSAQCHNEELRRISEEMTTKISEQEKIVMKAVTKANDLLPKNEFLEKLLQNTQDELESSKNAYERKLQNLSDKINEEAQHTWQASEDVDRVNTAVETLTFYEDKEVHSADNQIVKRESRKQQLEKSVSNKRANQKGVLKDGSKKKETLHGKPEIHNQWYGEKEELEKELVTVRKEAQKLFQENSALRTLIDEKKKADQILHFELEKLKVQYNELKQYSLEMNLDNKNLRKQRLKLQKDNQHNKEEEKDLLKIEEQKSSRNMNHGQETFKDPFQQEPRAIEDVIMHDRTGEARSMGEKMYCRELSTLEGKTAEIGFCTAHTKSSGSHSGRALKMNSGQENNICDLAKLLNEVALLNEKNKQMEAELKEMQERYSEISLKFAEVEGERQQLVMTLRNLKNGKRY